MELKTNEKKEITKQLGEEIKEKYPKVNSVDIKITEFKGRFKTMIEVRFQRKRFFVKKMESSLGLGLYKAKKALIKQFEKHQSKKLRYRVTV